MINKRYKIVLDLTRQELSNVETLVQNDINSNEFEIDVFDNGEKYVIAEGSKAEIACKKSDGTVVVDEVQYMDNMVMWTLSKQVLTASGYVEAELRVLEDGNILTASQSFKFLVRPNMINDETIMSTSQYRALDEAVKKAEELGKELQGVPEKVADIKAQFDTVKNSLENAKKELLAGLDLSNKNIEEIKAYLDGVNAEIEKLKAKEVDIANLKELLAKLDDLKARLANLEATLAEAKTTDSDLKTNINTSKEQISTMNGLVTEAKTVGKDLTTNTQEAKSTDDKLKGSITTGQTIVDKVSKADKDITGKINEASGVKQGLDDSISKGNTSKTNLDSSISKAESTKTNLDQSTTNAGGIKTNLDSSIGSAKTTKADLDGSIQSANNTKASVDESVRVGNEVNDRSAGLKTDLEASILKGQSTKTGIDSSIETANTAKNNLDGTIKTAETKNTELTGTTSTAEKADTDAKATIETLKALLSKSDVTEKGLKEIIESGDLGKYVTEIKLREELAKIEFKQVKVDTLPQTGEAKTLYFVKDPKGKNSNNYLEYLWIDGKFELIGSTQVDLTGYVKTPDLDPYAKTVDVDKKIADVNVAIAGKVAQKDGWGLSENNYSSADKAKVDGIPTNPKYTDTTYDLTPYAKKTDLNNVGKSKTSNNSGASAWGSGTREIEFWIGDFDKRTKENRDNINKKVDAVTGKTLTTNDYTNADKAKVDAIPSNPKYTDTTYDLSPYAKTTDVDTKLGGKVDKVTGKTLTTNDFTSTHKSKLDNLTSTASGNEATTSNRGYMSASDKSKLNGLKNVTKLSELAGDSTHRLVSDTEKTTWNGKADKSELSSYVKTADITDFKRCKILTQSEYDALSSTEKNRADTLYFIKK